MEIQILNRRRSGRQRIFILHFLPDSFFESAGKLLRFTVENVVPDVLQRGFPEDIAPLKGLFCSLLDIG